MALTQVKAAGITADAIDETKLADDSIDSEHYNDGSIDHAHLANDCVDGDNIQDDAVNSEHIAAGAVDLEHMSSESVDEDNLHISNAGSNGQYLQKQSGNAGGLTWATVAAATDTLSFRNLLMNGDMSVSQRTDQYPGEYYNRTSNGYYGPDRWKYGISSHGTYRIGQLTASPPTGFSYYANIRCTTADTSIAAASYVYMSYSLEGNEVQQILKGSGSAKQLSLQFWVKAASTGTCVAELVDEDNSRHCCVSFSISSADTWEKKTMTFPADTTGALDSDANESMKLLIWIIAGSNYTSGTLATSWASTTTANRAVGANLNVGDAVDDYFRITGMQLELGDTNTDFEYIPTSVTLRGCQRYLWFIGESAGSDGPMVGWVYNDTNTSRWLDLRFPVIMRATPTCSFSNPASGSWANEGITKWSGSGRWYSNTAGSVAWLNQFYATAEM